jgi:tetratricopeptide (TPR) repeat protein
LENSPLSGNDATTTDASDAVGRYTRGLLLRSQGCFDQAAGQLQELVGQDDTLGLLARYHYALAHRSLAGEALSRGDFPAAQRHLQTAMDAVGAQAGLGGLLAGLYARCGRPAECLREMEKAHSASAGKDSPEFHRKLAQAQWQAGRRQEAYMTLAQALRRFGGLGSLHLQWGLFLAAEEKYAEARQRLALAAQTECDNADAYRYLALSAAALGDAPAAARNFQRALDLCPDDLMLAYQLSLAARAAEAAGTKVVVRLPAPSAGAATGDLHELARRIADEPDLIEALCSLPSSDLDNDLFSMLAGAVELAIEAHPRHADLHLAASRVYLRLGQQSAAQLRAQKALEINPGHIRARLHMAELCGLAGRADAAAGHYRRAIGDGADWPDVHLRAGEALIGLGRVEEARRHLRRALELNAGYSPAAEALEALEALAA